MVFDKTVDFTISGKAYKLCYPIKRAWEMEQNLSQKSIFATIAAIGASTPRMQDLFIMLKYALLGGQEKMTEEEAEILVYAAIGETPGAIYPACMQALQLSGLLPGVKKEPAAGDPV